MKKLLLLILLIPSIVYGTNYYVKPVSRGGNNANTGRSPATAWATLGRAAITLTAGDTLFVMGGRYVSVEDSSNTSRRNSLAFSNSGTAQHPIVVKAYGDTIAYFGYTGGDRSINYITIGSGISHVIVDGFSYLNPSDSLMIKFEGRLSTIAANSGEARTRDFQVAVSISGDDCRIRGIEIDGNFWWDMLAKFPNLFIDGKYQNPYNSTWGLRPLYTGGILRRAFHLFSQAERDTIESCYVHHIFYPTGDKPNGDGSDREQGAGDCVFIDGSTAIVIRNNTFSLSNHSIMQIQRTASSIPRFLKIYNNKAFVGWGGGIYLGADSRWCLVEKNVIHMDSTTTYKTKGALAVDGSLNVVRDNAVYSPGNTGSPFSLMGQTAGGYSRSADSNLVYNNTVFSGAYHLFKIEANGAGNRTRGNIIANNVFYYWNRDDFVASSVFGLPRDSSSAILLYFDVADNDNNWVYPDTCPSPTPYSTKFEGHKFWNNLAWDGIEEHDLDCVCFQGNRICGGGSNTRWYWNIDTLDARYSDVWSGNITEVSPRLYSETPSASNMMLWWKIDSLSPCIDAGIVIDDTIGEYVNNRYGNGYGWGQRYYYGDAPDIGAFEYVPTGYTTPDSCSVSTTFIEFPLTLIDDCSDSVFVVFTNESSDSLYGTVSLISSGFELLSGGGNYALAPDEQKIVWVRYHPLSLPRGYLWGEGEVKYGYHTGVLDLDCATVSLYGTCRTRIKSYSIDSTTINFESKPINKVSQIRKVKLKNDGETSISIYVELDSGVNFSILSGSGEHILEPEDSIEINIRFEPKSTGLKTDYLIFGDEIEESVELNGLALEGANCLLSKLQYDFSVDTLSCSIQQGYVGKVDSSGIGISYITMNEDMYEAFGQMFTPDRTVKLDSIKVALGRWAAYSGSAYITARIESSYTGSYGSTAHPVDFNEDASSTNYVSIAELHYQSYSNRTFYFSGNNSVTLNANTHYAFYFDWSAPISGMIIRFRNSLISHEGNRFYFDTIAEEWWSVANDIGFIVYGSSNGEVVVFGCDSLETEVIIKNTGQDTLNTNVSMVQGDYIKITENDGKHDILPGDSVIVKVKFIPDWAGSYIDTMSVESCDNIAFTGNSIWADSLYSVSSVYIDWGEVELPMEDSIEREIIYYNNTPDTVKCNIYVSNARWKLSKNYIEIPPGSNETITIYLFASSPNGHVNTTLYTSCPFPNVGLHYYGYNAQNPPVLIGTIIQYPFVQMDLGITKSGIKILPIAPKTMYMGYPYLTK